ncbi:MAG: acyl-CoA dehydrogenase family protein [Advenella sp.]|uniref:acyl-CoA dehydrogenase family protein n=1 Tax=unclassified Advenella TaxID=2685285 RepID=UPI001865F11A|nr:acyl-CoA dehydrogenase family protein [Advenella sp. FME57]
MQHTDDDLLLDPVRRFLAEQCPLTALRGALLTDKPLAGGVSGGVLRPAPGSASLPSGKVAADDASCNGHIFARLWSQLCELGWPGLLVGEARGGIGLGMSQAVKVMELAGSALLPLPLGTWMNTSAFLSEQAAHSPVSQWLDRCMHDGRLAGFAIDAGQNRLFVPYCRHDSQILFLSYAQGKVWARVADGIAGGPGIDPFIHNGWLGAPVWQMQDDFACDKVSWDAFELRSRMLVAAELLGVAARALDMTSAYARERQQFGRPIGSFQAIKHRLAQDWMDLDNARLLLTQAAACMDSANTDLAQACPELPDQEVRRGAELAGPTLAAQAQDRADQGATGETYIEETTLMAILAEHTIQQAASTAVRNALQVHGALGMTWECDVHFYLKRVHFLCAMMNHRHTEADRLQQVWQLSAGRMAI